jgi:hypothetical protein
MARWMEFIENYDHRWPSGAITAFDKGMKVFVKPEVADEAEKLGVAKKTDKPADDDPAHRSTPTRLESKNLTTRERRTPQTIVLGGALYGKPGNPINLPDPADPEAVRSEPMLEKARAATDVTAAEAVADAEAEQKAK